MNLSELSEWLYLYGNDLRFLHLQFTGKEFETYHFYLQDLYDAAFGLYDYCAESAISHGEVVINPTVIYEKHKFEWNPIELNGNGFTLNDVINYVNTNGKFIIDCINDVSANGGYESFVISNIDEFSATFDKIINYKFGQVDKGL